jgi:hypothetical protein
MKPKFRIGDLVLVKATLDFFYDKENNRCIMRNEITPPFEAQVTGATRKYLGKYKSGVSHGTVWDEEPEYDPPYLSVVGSILAWKVREGLLNKEHICYQEDLELVTTFNLLGPIVTKWKQTRTIWTKEARDDLRKIMYDVPRRKDGKWTK